MKVGFDIDGVVLTQDLFALRSIDLATDQALKGELSKFYYLSRRILLNPLDFLAEEDELFLITGRNKSYKQLKEFTEKWKEQRFPKATLILTNHDVKEDTVHIDNFFVKHAKLKAHFINKLGIDVYFEDTPEIVEELRKLCPRTKIIQYGGRLKSNGDSGQTEALP